MSSYPYAQYTYTQEGYNGYPVEQQYGYENSTSPSSFGGGSHAMTATNSSQSMSSTAESPSAWEWDAQQQSQYATYNTMSSDPQAYFSLPEDLAYTPRQIYYQPTQPAQEPSPSQRTTTESAPSALICLHPHCPTTGRFKRKADLHRHMDTVHAVKQRFSCPRPKCDRKHDRGFSRRDHLYEHLRNTHGVEVATAGGEKRRRRTVEGVVG